MSVNERPCACWSRRALHISSVLVVLAVGACSEDAQRPEEQTVARLMIEPAEVSIRELATVQFKAVAVDERGREFNAPVVWTSTSSENATIDDSGLATGVRGGYARVMAEAGGRTATALVYVEEYAASIEFAEPGILLDPAASHQLEATIRCRNQHEVAALIRWKTSNGSVAVVNDAGLVSAVEPGTATITATAGEAQQTVTVVVREPVADVLVEPQQLRLRIHQTTRLHAQLRTRLGSSADQPVVWSSLDAQIAKVAPDGTVEGIAAGSTTITAESEGRTGYALVIVDEPLASIRVVPSSARLTVNTTMALAAEARNTRGEVVALPLAWSSRDPGIATVDAAGVVTAVAPGSVVIDAAAEGRTGSATILVEARAAKVVISPASATVVVGGSLLLAARATDAGGVAVDPPIHWSSSDPDIAGIDNAGVVFGWASGTVLITAEADGLKGTAAITVSAAVAAVSVTPNTVTLYQSESVQLVPALSDRLGRAMSGSVTWESSDTTVATVNQAGVVTGVTAGTATIVAKAGNVTGTATVVVSHGQAGSPHHILVTPGSAEIDVGETLSLSAVAHDENDDPISVTIAWSSSDPSIATVDPVTGLVTGKAEGQVVISAEAGGVKGSAVIKVGHGSGGGGGGGGGGEEGIGNNLSWPVVFSEGFGVTGLPVATDPGVRPTTEEGIVVPGNSAFFYSGNVADYQNTWFTQQSENTWRAEWLDGSASMQEVQVDWGDNLVSHTFGTHAVIRVEVALYSRSVANLTGFNMSYLYGTGPDEMQGTDGTTGLFQPSVFAVTPRLTIEKLDTLKNPIPGTIIFDGSVADGLGVEGPGSYGAEVNVAGKIVYGYNLFIKDAVLPANIHKYGWWRITFSLLPQVTVGGVTVVRNTKLVELLDVAGLYVPVLDAAGTSSSIDIWVDSASGGGGGGGGHTSSLPATVSVAVRR